MIEDRINLFLEWEMKHGLFDWKIQGTNIWGYIRRLVYETICELKYGEYYDYHIPYLQSNDDSSLIRLYKYGGFTKCHKCDVLFVNMMRRFNIDGVYVSPFLDGLVDGLKYSFTIMEEEYIFQPGRVINTPNIVFYNPWKMAIEFEDDYSITFQVKRLIHTIEKDFKVKFTKELALLLNNNMQSIIQNRKPFMEYYYHLLKKMHVKVVVFVNENTQYNKYLIEAANCLGIKTVEYEHAIFNESTIINRYAKNNLNLPMLCKYWWSRSKVAVDAGMYQYSQVPIENFFYIGNEYQQRRVTESRQKHLSFFEGKKNILVVSDSSIKCKLAELAFEIDSLIDNSEYRVVFKIHPEEIQTWRDKYSFLIGSRVVVAGEDRLGDIYDYLSISECVIGSISTALREAVDMDKKVFLYIPDCADANYDSFLRICEKDLLANDCAEIIRNAKQFVCSLDDFSSYKPPTYIYEKNPIKNANYALRELMS